MAFLSISFILEQTFYFSFYHVLFTFPWIVIKTISCGLSSYEFLYIGLHRYHHCQLHYSKCVPFTNLQTCSWRILLLASPIRHCNCTTSNLKDVYFSVLLQVVLRLQIFSYDFSLVDSSRLIFKLVLEELVHYRKSRN
jgi:hypothetical protein